MAKDFLFVLLLGSLLIAGYFLVPKIFSPSFLGGEIFLKTEFGKTTKVTFSDCEPIFNLIGKIRKRYPMIMPPSPEPKNKIVALLFIGRDSHERYEMEILLASGTNPIANITLPSQSPYVSTTSYFSLDEEGTTLVKELLLKTFKAGKSKEDEKFLSEIEGFF